MGLRNLGFIFRPLILKLRGNGSGMFPVPLGLLSNLGYFHLEMVFTMGMANPILQGNCYIPCLNEHNSMAKNQFCYRKFSGEGLDTGRVSIRTQNETIFRERAPIWDPCPI